jgi:hypothetical protein
VIGVGPEQLLLDENHLKRWIVALDLIVEDLDVGISSIVVEDLGERPWNTKCAWGRFTVPPFYGCINSIQRKSAERLLDIVCQPAKSKAESQATVIQSEHLRRSNLPFVFDSRHG